MTSILVYSTQLLATGGIESHLFEFIRHLTAESDIKIDILVRNARVKQECRDTLLAAAHRCYLIRKSPIHFLVAACSIGTLSRLHPYDALYTNGQGESIDAVRRITRAKTWVHHHHMSGDAADQASWGPKYSSAMRNADRLVACSKRNAEDLRRALHRDVIVVPCFSRQLPIRTSAKKTGKIRLGYFGRLVPEKGIDLLCQLSDDSALSNIEFNIWGEGPKYPPSFFEPYRNLNYRGRFDGKEELAQVLASLDGVLLLSSHAEGLPVCLLEAMSAGVPWLATDRGGIRDISDNQAGTRLIGDLKDYDRVREAVAAFATSLAERRAPSIELASLYAKLYSPQVVAGLWRNTLALNTESRPHS